MDDEIKAELIDWDSELLKVSLDLLDERVRDALREIERVKDEAHRARMTIAEIENDAYALLCYLKLIEAEEECCRLISRRQGQKEFLILVRAATAARELEQLAEEQRRVRGGGFAAGVADAMAMAARRKQSIRDTGVEHARMPPPARIVDRDRIEKLPLLRDQVGSAYTFWQLATNSISKAGGDPMDVDWSAVENATIQESICEKKQTPQSVYQALCLHSPGAVDQDRRNAILLAVQVAHQQHQDAEKTSEAVAFKGHGYD